MLQCRVRHLSVLSTVLAFFLLVMTQEPPYETTMRTGTLDFLRGTWWQPSARMLILLGLYLATLASSPTAWVQGGYDISWISTDNGGGISSGGPFTLAGAIGQPEAGRLSGGTFVLKGGFWGGVFADLSPALSFEHDGNSIIIFWAPTTSGLVLETSESLYPAAKWTPVTTDGQCSVTITPASRAQFYRLVAQ